MQSIDNLHALNGHIATLEFAIFFSLTLLALVGPATMLPNKYAQGVILCYERPP